MNRIYDNRLNGYSNSIRKGISAVREYGYSLVEGDYGLFQDAQGRGGRTWDNEDWTMLAMEAQGFVRDENGIFQVPEDGKLSMRLPHDLIPADPKTGRAAAMNLRADDTFVEDAGWHAASVSYASFLKAHEGQHVLFLEIGVGGNTPVLSTAGAGKAKNQEKQRDLAISRKKMDTSCFKTGISPIPYNVRKERRYAA